MNLNSDVFKFDAIKLDLRSPYYFLNPAQANLPPGPIDDSHLVTVDAQGNTIVAGQVLQPPDLSYVKPGDKPAPTFDNGGYGDEISFAVNFTGVGLFTLANGSPWILPRPNNTRLSLLIVNSTVLGNIFYAFDRNADNTSCVSIAAGGNKDFSTKIPQGSLSLFSTGAGRAVIAYMNGNLNT